MDFSIVTFPVNIKMIWDYLCNGSSLKYFNEFEKSWRRKNILQKIWRIVEGFFKKKLKTASHEDMSSCGTFTTWNLGQKCEVFQVKNVPHLWNCVTFSINHFFIKILREKKLTFLEISSVIDQESKFHDFLKSYSRILCDATRQRCIMDVTSIARAPGLWYRLLSCNTSISHTIDVYLMYYHVARYI